VPYAVLIGGCLLTLGIAGYISVTARARTEADLLARHATFLNDAESTREQLEARVSVYLELLRAGAALLATRTELSPREFRSFVAGLHLPERYVGMEAIGFAEHVQANRLPSFRRGMALDGVRRLARWRPTPQAEYYPVVYLEPQTAGDWSSPLFDLTSQPSVMLAVERARDTGEPSASSELSDGRFLVVLPVYQLGAPLTTIDERRAAIVGVIISPFNAQALIEAVGAVTPSAVAFEVYDSPDPSSASLLTQPISVPPQAFESILHLQVAGREWSMVVRPTTAGRLAASSADQWMLYGGFGISFLLFLVTHFQVRAWESTVRHQAELRETAQALRESESQARAATRAKDEFLATLSHELRTPLNAILGWVSMLRLGSVREDRRENALAVIERNARLQAELIDDLLDISRIVMGKIRLRLSSTPVAPIVEGVVEALRPTADAKGVLLRVAPLPEVQIRGDVERVHQIVWNLATNAIKFTPSGRQVDIEVKVAGEHAQIAVRDQGIGIAPEFLPHVFERFRQADGSSTRAHHGLGLGLAIVQELVHLHGGQITAKSDGVDQGAEFVVSLPLAAAAETSPLPVLMRTPPTAASLRGLHVLVVDDDRGSLELMGEALGSLGAHVSTALSAADAMQVLGEESVDVLVSDLAMPDEDGYALMRRVRLCPEPLASLPAIALTAFARANDRKQAFEAGFHMHLAKPVDLGELESALVQVTQARRGTVPASDQRIM
jgi:signal transduction histidine kinase/ActR/RegA family two-component response regulator